MRPAECRTRSGPRSALNSRCLSRSVLRPRRVLISHVPPRKRHPYDQWSPDARALDLVGDKWTLLIVRDLVAGPRRFVELQRVLPGISTEQLRSRLNRMVADGMLTRKRYREVPPRVEYELTERARDLMPVLGELARWGYEWAWSSPRGSESIDIGAIFRLAPGLIRGNGADGTVEFVVGADGDEAPDAGVRADIGRGAGHARGVRGRARRRAGPRRPQCLDRGVLARPRPGRPDRSPATPSWRGSCSTAWRASATRTNGSARAVGLNAARGDTLSLLARVVELVRHGRLKSDCPSGMRVRVPPRVSRSRAGKTPVSEPVRVLVGPADRNFRAATVSQRPRRTLGLQTGGSLCTQIPRRGSACTAAPRCSGCSPTSG